MLTPLPRDTDAKPGAAMRPFFGVKPAVLDANGNEIHGNGVEGVLAFQQTPPSMARTIYGSHKRYVETYLKPYKGYYYTGDAVRRDEDGHLWITGRVDDVINVSGHRLSTAEIEGIIDSHEAVAEAAVIGVNHDVKVCNRSVSRAWLDARDVHNMIG
jgi:acetyl-CoA synthetase